MDNINYLRVNKRCEKCKQSSDNIKEEADSKWFDKLLSYPHDMTIEKFLEKEVEKSLGVMSDEDVQKAVDEVVLEHKGLMKDIYGKLLGPIMKKTKGKATGEQIGKALKKRLV